MEIPKCGRIVHYYPNGVDVIAGSNFATVVPAIVIQSFGDSNHLNLQVFTMNGDAPNVLRFSVYHKSEAPEGAAYWENTEN